MVNPLTITLGLLFLVFGLVVWSYIRPGRKGQSSSELSRKSQELVLYVHQGDIERMKQVISEGADVDVRVGYKYTPLILAVKHNNLAATQLLLENKANPNLQGSTGETALSLAITTSNSAIVETLLAGGADANQKGFSHFPLQDAAIFNPDASITKMLLKAGADLSRFKISSGDTPLQYALYQNKPDIIEALQEPRRVGMMA